MTEPVIGSIKWIGEKMLDLLAESVEKRIFKDIDPQLSDLQEDLKDIRKTQEDMLIGPLDEGLRFLRLGDVNKALEKIGEAESKNPLAPVPKAWLAICFLHLQKDREAAANLVSEALALNPYYLFDGPDELAHKLPSAAQHVEVECFNAESKRWFLPLDGDDLIKHFSSQLALARRIAKRYFGAYTSFATAAVKRASFCSNRIAIQWLLADNLRHKRDEILGLFGFQSSYPSWAHFNRKQELLFISPRFVVVKYRDRDLYGLLDVTNGSCVKKMSDRYFRVMFGGWNPKGVAGTRSNWTGTSPEEAYVKSARFQQPPVVSSDTTFGHIPTIFEEAGMLQDLCEMHGHAVRVSNKWEHVHRPGSINMLPSCRLVAAGRIVWEPIIERES